jgi:hypothetical protein
LNFLEIFVKFFFRKLSSLELNKKLKKIYSSEPRTDFYEELQRKDTDTTGCSTRRNSKVPTLKRTFIENVEYDRRNTS